MDYDLGQAFEAIEDELIDSMMRNLDRHRAEEAKRGFQWSQWQVEQLKALETYRRNNQKKFPQRFGKINRQIRTLLQDSYHDGSTKQERQILQAIRRGFKGTSGTNAPAFTEKGAVTGAFFRTNDKKLDALIEATTHDMQKAETAVLRRANDQYRKIIFNAQVFANTGAGTYEKAVDMATRDFLKAGINSITYKNGSQHTISEYAKMAIQTASKRAYLQGEGEKRKEFGVTTVILNKRTCACPKCLPFVGKVFIDDVWSGGDKSGISPVTGIKYPLLSDAIRLGLYHPNCRDVHSTYFEGISTPPESSAYTKEELAEIAERYEAEQKQAYCETQAKKYGRLEEYSLDKDNKRVYGARAKEWESRAENLSVHRISETNQNNPEKNIIASSKSLANSGGSGIIKVGSDGMYRKKSVGKIEPMPKKQFHKIEKSFKRKGGVFQYDKETDAYLKSKDAEAITYNANTILLKTNPGRASVFEELIHTYQYRVGKNDGSYLSRLQCEIEAQKKLIRCSKAYKLTEPEIQQTKAALKAYEEELAAYIKRETGGN